MTVPTALDDEAFLASYPEYDDTRRLDELRATEYGYLDRQGHVYLDCTGGGLASRTQYQAHHDRLAAGCFGNPHSVNPTSLASTELIERARARVLRHLNASDDEYVVIFTPNATAACRLVGEAYPFDTRSKLVLTFDNHNSVNGIREFARRKRVRATYVPLRPPDLRTTEADVRAALGRRATRRRGLFAYPAQSNFTGVRHPLSWVDLAHDHGYDVLLDCAAFLPTSMLDLSRVRPDFVTVSWYKLFGHPTGVGCLVARREALARLRRPWFAGGTIQVVSVQGDWHSMAPDEAAFEDGTLNYLSIPDVETGLNWLTEVGIDLIARRVRCLTGWLLDRLTTLTHGNGAPIAKIHGPRDLTDRGGTVAFNLLDPTGTMFDVRQVQRESAAARISLRTGCFCNPGAGENAFEIDAHAARHRPGRPNLGLADYLTELGLTGGGAIRVSFGVASTIDDVQQFLTFTESTYRNRTAPSGQGE